MEILMDYHLLFMTISIILFVLTLFFFFIDNNKEKTVAGSICNALNWMICIINVYGFFGIGILGFDTSGNPVITAHHEMMALYVVFYAIYWICTVLFFYAYWLFVRKPWDTKNTGLF